MTRTATVHLRHLPVELHRRASEHIDGLVREFQLMSSEPSDDPNRMLTVGNRLRRRSHLVTSVIMSAVADAAAQGIDAVDLDLEVPVEAVETCRSVDALLDEADQFCRDGGMLTLATPPDVRAFRQWFLGEFCRQIEGEEPLPWPAYEASTTRAEGTR